MAKMSEEDWWALDFEVSKLFDSTPIDEEELFAGRPEEVLTMLRSTMEKGRHVVLYGEKGVGKTSLSNIFWKRYNAGLQSFVVAKVQSNPDDDFSSLWIRALQELKAAGIAKNVGEKLRINDDYQDVTPSELRREFQKINPNLMPVIIIDEYNEVEDEHARRLTANLIKELYDYSAHITIILVGVAENIETLLEDHASVDRALVQVPLNRMSNQELLEIIRKRDSKTALSFDNDSKWTIVALSKGLPYFTQILSKFAAQSCIKNRRLTVQNSDVEAAMTRFIKESGASLKESYLRAIRSNQVNYFPQSLLACALAETDDEGFFTATDVLQPYSGILKETKQIAHFKKHLKRFSSDEGGNILISRGGERKQIFRFQDPMMQVYVIIRGVQSNMIDKDSKNTLLKTEQRSLAI